MSHTSYREYREYLLEDLSCHGISIRAACTGSAEFATIPSGANIYIYEESSDDYVLQSVQTGTISNPSIINDIECTSPTRSNKFKLSLSGYVDVEGILEITQETIYKLNIIMERCTVTEAGGLLLPALALAGFIFLVYTREKNEESIIEKYEQKYEQNNLIH